MKVFYRLLPIISALFLIIFFSGIATSCNTTEPPPPNNGSLSISLTDVSCTEMWVNLKANGVTFPISVSFLTDGSTIAQLNNLNSSDTTIYIDSLLPNKSYQMQAQFAKDNLTTSSNKLAVQTLDTTSNNFTWQTFTFGDPNGGSCSLNDVAVIDANDIWAVGEIFMDDSTGQPDPLQYNAIHWNGNNWTVIRIPYYYQGQPYYNPIQTVFAFSSNDIWFAGNGVLHWDGNQYNPVPLPSNVWGQDQINKIWGSSDNDLYIIGNSGSIAHYNGTTWQKIESGTTTDINDICGVNDSLVLAAVSSRYHIGDYKLLSVTPNTAKDYIGWPYTRLYGVWFQNERNIYITGSGAFVYKNGSLATINLPTNSFLTRAKGSGLNDIYIAGCCNTLVHFNGYNWQLINGVYGNYEGMDVKGNLATAVGWTGSQAIIVMVKRQ
jgi:hypothetical protein